MLEPNIVFYQQTRDEKNQSTEMLTKVLDEINFTEDTRSSARNFPKATLQKVNSYFSKEETLLSVDSSTKFFE